jgi:hypothetical protein
MKLNTIQYETKIKVRTKNNNKQQKTINNGNRDNEKLNHYSLVYKSRKQ